MSQIKLFGTSRNAAHMAKPTPGNPKKEKKQKVKRPLRTLAIILAIVLFLEGAYFFCVYSKNPFITKWRNIYINTAMNTMTHQWLATAFLPEDVVDSVRHEYGLAIGASIGKNSMWSEAAKIAAQKSQEPHVTEVDAEIITEDPQDPVETIEPDVFDEEDFYEIFWEIDESSMTEYVEQNPSCLSNGWENIQINEAGLDDEGTSIRSIFGEQVLALDVPNQVALFRVQGSGYVGVLAVAKDSSKLSIEMASTLGQYGQLCGTIAEDNNGVLSMNASGFLDPNGGGNGGQLAGYCMSNGTAYGQHFGSYAYKRIELHEDNLFYIKDVFDPVSDDCTDATEFQPAMIVDGEKVIDYAWTGDQPRACIGQSENFEILMLVIEGRRPLEGIIGTNVNTCSDILMQHKCFQAMNVDGGSSAMMWFDGKYVMVSSSPAARYTGGRPLPNAFVYKKAD